jgi:hypothetical protein
MITRFRFTFLIFAILLSGWACAQKTPGVALLALSKQDHTLAIVDPTDLKVLVGIPIGDDPHEVIASVDGKTAYASNHGRGTFCTLAVVDLVNQRPLRAIDLGPLYGPYGLAFVQGKVRFTAETDKVIGRYDPTSGKLDWVMGIGQDRTHMLYVLPDARHIVTTNVSSATVTHP